ncbi:MAG: TMEM165/GDT1 family protein [Rhodanobacteraceae bacterium]|nr:MAG: TMEM165/GDT1 family protein [Rhodanobacteraceae bacterium]
MEIPLQAFPVSPFLVSFGAVALAEIGDKTQLLSLVLAAKFKKPWPICSGILVASLLSHAIAAELGAWLAHWMTPGVQRWLIGLSFLAVAAWALLPEKEEPVDTAPRRGHGVFAASVVAFFLAELGDRTQIATVVLGAHYQPLWQVIAGSTAGMLVANVPVVWLGARFASRLPLRATRLGAAVLFAALGLWILLR